MVAVTLALLASIATGATDYIAGVKSRRFGVLTVVTVTQISSLALIAVVVAIGGLGDISRELVLFAAISAVGSLGGILAFWHGLSVGSMGVVAPITATGVTIPVAFGLLRGEEPGTLQLIGIAIAAIGVVLASYEPGAVSGEGGRIAAGVGFALLAALGIGFFYTAIDAASERSGALSAAFGNRLFTVVLIALPAILLRRHISLPPRDAPGVASAGLLEAIATFLFAAASTQGLLTVVGGISALYPVTTVLLAHVLLHERLHPSQMAGTAAALVGIATVGAGVAGG